MAGGGVRTDQREPLRADGSDEAVEVLGAGAGGVGHPGLRESEVYVEDFLYDLEADPHERRNLVREAGLAGERARLAEVLKRRMEEAGESAPEIRPAG